MGGDTVTVGAGYNGKKTKSIRGVRCSADQKLFRANISLGRHSNVTRIHSFPSKTNGWHF